MGEGREANLSPQGGKRKRIITAYKGSRRVIPNWNSDRLWGRGDLPFLFHVGKLLPPGVISDMDYGRDVAERASGCPGRDGAEKVKPAVDAWTIDCGAAEDRKLNFLARQADL